jgi:hypothetical protein
VTPVTEWVRVDEAEHPRWVLPGQGRHVTDFALRTFGRRPMEKVILKGLRPCPRKPGRCCDERPRPEHTELSCLVPAARLRVTCPCRRGRPGRPRDRDCGAGPGLEGTPGIRHPLAAPGPFVFLDLRCATDTATILSRLGHEVLATLITVAVAIATEEPADQPEGADSDTQGHR